LTEIDHGGYAFPATGLNMLQDEVETELLKQVGCGNTGLGGGCLRLGLGELPEI